MNLKKDIPLSGNLVKRISEYDSSVQSREREIRKDKLNLQRKLSQRTGTIAAADLDKYIRIGFTRQEAHRAAVIEKSALSRGIDLDAAEGVALADYTSRNLKNI